MNILYKSELQTFMGNISLFFNEKGLIKISMTSCFDAKWYRKYFHNAAIKLSNDNIYISQLKEYFKRKRKKFDFPFVLYGTFFQKEVWRFVHKIPFGETMTYSEVTRGISRKSAQRAAGNALAKNPLLIVIPCHRIIKSDGSLGGFSAGIEIKRRLLEFEKSFSVSDEPRTCPPLSPVRRTRSLEGGLWQAGTLRTQRSLIITLENCIKENGITNFKMRKGWHSLSFVRQLAD